jgi:hypothetical protein
VSFVSFVAKLLSLPTANSIPASKDRSAIL